MIKGNIFTVGGTVQAGYGFYISRRADDELLKLCRAGNFAYVLTPRQLGKSSLMVRTAEQLTEEGVRPVTIDLSQIGVQVTAEQWYLGLLSVIEDQLNLSTNVVTWWQERPHLGMTQRLTLFFQDVLLKEVSAPVVIFVDEIDTTLSLSFTDDFFAAIRYFYNARALSKEFQRLSFVLIGVATPGDLVRDPQRTPFNIGRRVDLTDFTSEEAMPFAAGLGLSETDAKQVLDWVLKWTGGHPYLTQRLCRELVDQNRNDWTETEVDQIVANTFFAEKSRQDDNLRFVRDLVTQRVPQSVDVSDLLTTYRDIRGGRVVADEEQSVIKSHLKLSGVVKGKNSVLRVRNQIYYEVFNERWIKEHLPDTWTRRQLVRLQRVAAVLIAGFFILVPMAVYALTQRNAATARAIQLERTVRLVEEQREEANRQKASAFSQKAIAEQNAHKAYEESQIAEKQTKRAEEAVRLADASAQQARDALKVAEGAQARAEQSKRLAEEQTKIAEQQRFVAEQQRFIAEAERARAEKDEADTLAAINSFSQSEKQKALDYYLQTLRQRRLTGDRSGEAATLNVIALVNNSVGKGQEALRNINLALQIRRDLKDRSGEARTLNSLGKVLQAQKQYGVAYEAFRQALDIFHEISERTGEAITLANLGKASLDQNDRNKAVDYYNRALALFRDTGNRQGETDVLYNLGEAYASGVNRETQREREDAITFYSQVLALHHESGNLLGEGDTLDALMTFWRGRGNPTLSIVYGKLAVNVFQKLRTQIRTLGEDMQNSFLQSKEHTYRQLADSLSSEKRIAEAQQVLGLLKQAELTEFVRSGVDLQPLANDRVDLTGEEGTIATTYESNANRVALLVRQKYQLSQKKSRTIEEEQQLADINSEMKVAQTRFEQYFRPTVTEHADELNRSSEMRSFLRELGPGVAALYTLRGEDTYRVILTTADVQLGRSYPIKAADLNRKIMSFRQALLNPKLDARPLGHELYKILIEPIAKDLEQSGAKTLLWSLDGALRYVPMAALYDGRQYLAERYENINLTNASLATLRDQPSPKWNGLGLGVTRSVSTEHIQLPPLPGVAEELRAVFNADTVRGTLLLDQDFTLNSMLARLRERYKVVHIASTFVFDAANPAGSFLVLGDGTLLTLEQMRLIPTLFAGVELLTLSASNTALVGINADGTEVDGFAALAQRLGAKSVLASLWNVSDKSTTIFMREFYLQREREPGITKAEALRQAQLSLLHRSEYSHPFYWAPFILTGNWQ